MYGSNPDPPLVCRHQTLLIMAISCKGQVATDRGLKKPPVFARKGAERTLAITRYCFTLRLIGTNQSSCISPLPTRIAHTIALLLHNYCARYDPHPTSRVYAIHHTISVMAISCKGQNACWYTFVNLNPNHLPIKFKHGALDPPQVSLDRSWATLCHSDPTLRYPPFHSAPPPPPPSGIFMQQLGTVKPKLSLYTRLPSRILYVESQNRAGAKKP